MANKLTSWSVLAILMLIVGESTRGSIQSVISDGKEIHQEDCTPAKTGTSIDVSLIAEPVAAVTLSAPRWTPATPTAPAYCAVDGRMSPVDRSATAKPILFRVALPAGWNGRAVQIGGGGTNGVIPNLTGEPLQRGFATYGSDSGHQNPPAGPRGGPPNPAASDWWLNDEAVRNFGFMQMKKTHDAAIVIIERLSGQRPRFNYYIGNSQGGREALTVAQRYFADYDGISATVPVVSLSSLQVAPVLIRLQEKPIANWVTSAKVNAIRKEFMRQCDKLDGLTDGIINNYVRCRAIFDVSQSSQSEPWAAIRCRENVDPNPADSSAGACLTDGQISTLHFVYSRYAFTVPMAHNARSFGMWVPNTDPSGSSLMATTRFKGQEGGSESAQFSYIGAPGITGGLMRDLNANPLDYSETGALVRRRQEISEILDSANPDLSNYYRRGGKLIVTIGTNDTLASPGAQLDYYQSVIDKMGQTTVDQFARFFVIPQAGHGLSGTNYSIDGDGTVIPTTAIPNTFDRLTILQNWVEKKIVPGKSLVVTAGGKSLPLCSYPAFPKYAGGPTASAESYTCSTQ